MSKTDTSPLPGNVRIAEITPENIAHYGVCGYKDVSKHSELQRKIKWFGKYYEKGLRAKQIVTENGQSQGMLEYIPGEYAHRPVNAKDYLFIHCIFVGYRKEYKGKGHASALINECVKEAKAQKKRGVAVVARKSSFMAKSDIFLKNGFVLVEKAKPDFDLLALKFNPESENPSFKIPSAKSYPTGITVIRSAQCPYSVKNVEAILKTAEKMNIETQLIEILDAEDAQQTPCAFGTFCIIYNGKVISHHPISNKRFENIMKQPGK